MSSTNFYDVCAIPKGERQRRLGKARKRRAEWQRSQVTRDYVFERERDHCRICLRRFAQTMHELIFRSLGGKVCISNSVAVCGDGVLGCHGYAQRHEIDWRGGEDGAEGILEFCPMTTAAAIYMGVPINRWIRSAPRALAESQSA